MKCEREVLEYQSIPAYLLRPPPSALRHPPIPEKLPGDALFSSTISHLSPISGLPLTLLNTISFVDRMPVGLDISSSARSPTGPGPHLRNRPEIDSSAEALWTSHFDDPSTMTATAGNGSVPPANASPSNGDISASQRMISASAGNILTGLLGESTFSRSRYPHPRLFTNPLTSHPPRCRSRPFTVTNR